MHENCDNTLIYYSLVNRGTHSALWVKSIRSLRAHNPAIPVHLFFYDGLPGDVRQEAKAQSIVLHDCGEYRSLFSGSPSRLSLLGDYPVLHKLRHGLMLPDAHQILFVDCDTWFFDDPCQLFRAYTSAQVYAREEVLTRRSHFGYDPSWIDEDRLAAIAAAEGVVALPPLNTGVILMNRGVWREIAGRQEEFLDFALRLLDGSLDYPSSSRWIAEELATCLVLGKIAGLSLDLMSRIHVIQGSECTQDRLPGITPVVAHYWSNNEAEFFGRL
jgi:hypothetical protein